MSLTTSLSADGNTHIINIKGKFDFNLIQDFRNAYEQITEATPSLIIDLRETEYMDSSALGMLLNMQKSLDGIVTSYRIANSSAQIKKILLIARFDKKFDID